MEIMLLESVIQKITCLSKSPDCWCTNMNSILLEMFRKIDIDANVNILSNKKTGNKSVNQKVQI